MKKKKYKLKKGVWIFLVLIIFVSIGIFAFIKIREDYLYKQTYEYKFSVLNYNSDEIKLLLQNLEKDALEELLLKEKDETLIKLMQEKFYDNNYLDRYLNYLEENEEKTFSEIVSFVNMNLDYDFYDISLKANPDDGYALMVNKYYLLDESYEPEDLITIPVKYCWGERIIRKPVFDAFLNMWNDAYEAGYYLMINSGYRSYSEQQEVYDDFKDRQGTKYADSIAARPGASEHQTGLALDIFEKSNSSTKTFKDSNAFKWLEENSYKYGFIIRFPEGKEHITGYAAEAWHYRYVGVDLAGKIHNLNITFDEYYANYLR